MNKDDDKDEITKVAPPPGYKGHKEEEVIVPPPLPITNNSDIFTCYNLGDPVLLEQSIEKAIKNYRQVISLSKELEEILIVLLSDKYNDFQKDAPTNPWEMKEFLNRVLKDNAQTLSEFNKINNKRNDILNKLNTCDPTDDDIEAMLEIYPKIKDNIEFIEATIKIKHFLSDVHVMLQHSEFFMHDENINLVYNSIKEFNKTDEAIGKIKKLIEVYEKKEMTKEQEYFFAQEVLNDLSPKIVIKSEVKTKTVKVNKRLSELLDFIKTNQDYDTSTMNFEDYEKYNILACHLNLKNICISCLHNSSAVRNVEDVILLITEDALKGKTLNYNSLVKLLEKDKVPFVSYEKLVSNKKVIEDSLEKLTISCYAQSKIYEKENSWKNKLKLFVATASLVSMGIVGYVNDVHIHTPEVIKTQKEMTTKLYEEKKDAIRKMENDVLDSLSRRTQRIDNKLDSMNGFTDRQIKKVKDKKNRMKEKTKKIIDILKN